MLQRRGSTSASCLPARPTRRIPARSTRRRWRAGRRCRACSGSGISEDIRESVARGAYRGAGLARRRGLAEEPARSGGDGPRRSSRPMFRARGHRARRRERACSFRPAMRLRSPTRSRRWPRDPERRRRFGAASRGSSRTDFSDAAVGAATVGALSRAARRDRRRPGKSESMRPSSAIGDEPDPFVQRDVDQQMQTPVTDEHDELRRPSVW